MAPVARPTSRLAGTVPFPVYSHIWGLRPLSRKVSTEQERERVLVIRQFFARRASRKREYRRPGNVVSFRPLVPHRRAQKISPSLLDSHYTTANRVNRCRYPACCAWCAAKISSSRAASWHWPPLARWCGTARASSDCSDIGLTKGCANPNLEYGKGLRSF